jgi:hypothetical protein
MDNPHCCFPFQLIRDGVQIFSRVNHSVPSHVINRTYRSLVAQWMKNVQGSGVTLFAAPDKVNPSRQIFADVVTLQRLGHSQYNRGEGREQ